MSYIQKLHKSWNKLISVYIASSYHQIWHTNYRISLVVSIIVEMSINKITSVDDWTAELAIIVSCDIQVD